MVSRCQKPSQKPTTGTLNRDSSRTPRRLRLAGRPWRPPEKLQRRSLTACRLHSAESDCFVDYTDDICLFLSRRESKASPSISPEFCRRSCIRGDSNVACHGRYALWKPFSSSRSLAHRLARSPFSDITRTR